ncbi:hypothetical protein ACTXT7_004432 [Hymenolepis weldensis]
MQYSHSIHRIPGIAYAGTSAKETQSAAANTKATATDQVEGLQGLKDEIIGEVKGELHAFARQLMQFMNQRRLKQEISNGLTSEAETILGVRVANPTAQCAFSKAPSIDRARIGGVSVKYEADDSSKMSLALPKRIHSKQQNL